MRRISLIIFCLGLFAIPQVSAQQDFKNFRVAIYTRAQEVSRMNDSKWLESSWARISADLHVDKIYLETHRDFSLVDETTLQQAITFFRKKGLQVAGGITFTVNERNNFETFCYSNPEHRKKAREIVEFTASHFDEIILDDFFFTSCKCNLCIEAKGNQSWSDYRLALMTEAAKNLVVEPAKAVNPDVKVVIKYPNWYDHFQECGFNLETEPAIFDGLYTGTETRDAVTSDQHLQPYHGYLIVRYFDNLKPGHNGGGWVDTYGSNHFDRYAEQLWLTLFAKAPEITLFEFGAMASPLRPQMIAPWKDMQTSFAYDGFLPLKEGYTMARAAAHALSRIDPVVGELGQPYGIQSYKPYHSTGEDFLQNYFGMIGIPVNLVPEFPMDGPMLLLTEQAEKDPEIVRKIEKRLREGKDVMMTSGLLNALRDRGIRNIVNLEYTTRKALIGEYKTGMFTLSKGIHPVMIPQIRYSTNDAWEEISGLSRGLGWPIMVRGSYGTANLYVLAVPDNFAELYDLPVEVLNRIREIICGSLGIRFNGPSRVSLFLYDNNTIILESFHDDPVDIEVVLHQKKNALLDLVTGQSANLTVIPARSFMGMVISPEMYNLKLTLPPHSFRAFKIH